MSVTKQVLVSAVLCLFAAVANADDEAERRGAALLTGLKSVEKRWLGATALDVFRNQTRLGRMRIETHPHQGGGYEVRMRSEVTFGPRATITKTLVAALDVGLRPTQARGGVHRDLSNGKATDKYGFVTQSPTVFDYTFTEDAGGETESKRATRITVPRGRGVVVLDAFYCGFPELLLKMVPRQRYAFRAIDPDKGHVVGLTFIRGADVKRTLGGKRRETAAYARIAKAPGGETTRLSFSLDAKTGEILEIKIAESPLRLAPATDAPSKPDTSPTRVVLDFFTAVSKSDKAGLLRTLEPKTFIWNDTNKDPKSPTKKQFDALWARDAAKLTSTFADRLIAAAHESGDYPKGEDMSTLGTGCTEQVLGVGAKVRVRGVGKNHANFDLKKIAGRWRITKLRYRGGDGSSADSRARTEK